jgi:hypothetical protein
MSQSEKRNLILRYFPAIPRQHLARLTQAIYHADNIQAKVYNYVLHTVTEYDVIMAKVRVHYYDGSRAQARYDVTDTVKTTLNKWKGLQ